MVDVDLSAIIVPIVCFVFIAFFHAFEFRGEGPTRGLFKRVRKGWVEENYLKGQQAVNTTRDYVRVSLFFGNTAILIANFAAGFAATRYATCSDAEGGCTSNDIQLMIKIGCIVALMLSIFFLFTQCSRFIIHFSFMINTRDVNGVPLPKELTNRVFNHAHDYYGIGIRMYFMTIPVFAWVFTEWCLLAVTPIYLYIIHGLESSSFMTKELSAFQAQEQEKAKLLQSNAEETEENKGDGEKREPLAVQGDTRV
ncbi:hypothetical protein JKP88DRAFT_271858 [Tribonema minus]|uniref:DUF599 domain-containing protein n=1 Tax=Tribonema minus TaxID=303371 RepID=A0A835Z3S4_9STRA|nr:hypothetical protein JKP88DRAFT_271858 [Tribonema minus]